MMSEEAVCPACGYSIDEAGRQRPCPECGIDPETQCRLRETPPTSLWHLSIAAAVLQLPLLAWFGAWLVGALWAEYIVKPPAPFVQAGVYPSLDMLSNFVIVTMLMSFLATPVATLLTFAVICWGISRRRRGKRTGWKVPALPLALAATIGAVYLIVDAGLVWQPADWMPD
ncbi:MAG: hypothetical protein AB8G96_17545 [Phycisphaerales bacterium]